MTLGLSIITQGKSPTLKNTASTHLPNWRLEAMTFYLPGLVWGFVFSHIISRYNHDWPGTLYVDKADLEIKESHLPQTPEW